MGCLPLYGDLRIYNTLHLPLIYNHNRCRYVVPRLYPMVEVHSAAEIGDLDGNGERR